MPNWSARLIASPDDFGGAPLMRVQFALDEGHGEIASAVLHATAHGIFEAYLNGRPVSNDVLSPGWTSYEWRLRYRSYDVRDLLKPVSVLGFALGNGWWRGRLGWLGERARYGSDLGVFAQLEVAFEDGHRQVVVSDRTWTAGPSAVLENDFYDGERIDARRLSTGWLEPGSDDPAWVPVTETDFDPSTLCPYIAPPVRRQFERPPQEVLTSPSGRTIVDFGQNLVGWVRTSVRGPAGTEITLRHAEVLENGELGTRPLKSAAATDRFILSGGDDVFEPTFTFHGFRYVEVQGWPGEFDPGALVAVVISTDLDRTGAFECSDPLVTQLHSNALWGARGNFVDLPTDCPQRDERLGWTGDIAVFAPTAALLFDVDSFLRDWLKDLEAEQTATNGLVPYVIPDVLKYGKEVISSPESIKQSGADRARPDATAGWSDAAVWVPWALWQAYGDRRVLEDQFDSMAAHLRRADSLLSPSGLWDTGFQFGDWLDPAAPADNPIASRADSGVVATACLYRSAALVARIAALIDRPEAPEFAAMAERLRTAFNSHYVDEDGRIRSDAATVYTLAIVFGLLDEPLRASAGDRLAELVAQAGYRMLTGFLGTPYIADALTTTGHLDVAYRLLLQRECPSWLYPVTMGATTIWERWDSMLPDGSINPGEMTSFNHYAFGAVVDWMYRTIGGIAPLEPGYARVLIAPRPGGGLTSARTSLLTRHGRVAVAWSLANGRFELEIDLPAGVTGAVRSPDGHETDVAPGHRLLTFDADDWV